MSVYPLKIDKTQLAYRRHYGNKRTKKVRGIIIHHAAAIWTMQNLLDFMERGTRWVSSNYVIGNDGKIGVAVPHDYRAHTTNGIWDEEHITVEIGNSSGGPDWRISDKALRKLIELVAYSATKDGWTPKYTGTRAGTITYHGMYEATACPGPYLKGLMNYITNEANKLIAAMKNDSKPSKPSPNPSKTLYRVQTGAFAKRGNADALQTKLTRDGFSTYMVVGDDNLYRVQVGAYAVKSNADAMAKKLKNRGYDIYITTKSGKSVGSTQPKPPAIKVGDNVRVKQGATTYTGGGLLSHVYRETYTVTELVGTRAVISKGRTVIAAMRVTDLIRA